MKKRKPTEAERNAAVQAYARWCQLMSARFWPTINGDKRGYYANIPSYFDDALSYVHQSEGRERSDDDSV
jgi:hypothetical protein